MLTNIALWTIMITNLLAVIIPIIIANIIFTKTKININNVFTPGKEWLEITSILLTINIIYLINLEADRITNKIKNKNKIRINSFLHTKKIEKKYKQLNK